MIVRIRHKDGEDTGKYDRLIECDVIHQNVSPDGEELSFSFYKEGKLVDQPTFKKSAKARANIFIMEKGRTIDNIQFNINN